MTREAPPFDRTLAQEAFGRWADLHGTATRQGAAALPPSGR